MTIVVPGKGTADCTRRRRELVFGFLAGELERQRAPSIPIMPRTLRAFCLPLVALLLAAGVASAQSAADTTAIVQALAKAIALELRTPRDPGANSLDEDGPRFEISEANDELTVFLGPDLDFVDEIDAFVTKHFDFFFETLALRMVHRSRSVAATPNAAHVPRMVRRPDPHDGRGRRRRAV